MYRVGIPLRWSDLDAQGHVNNALFADYLQEARAAFFRAGPCSDLLDSGVVVVGHQVQYEAPITYSDAGIVADLGIVQLGGARFEVAYDLFQDAGRVAQARTVLCPFDFEAQRPTRLGLADREWLAAHSIQVEPLRDLRTPSLERYGTVTPCPVRWSDLDSYGHVNNVKVFDYLMQARIAATTSWHPGMARSGVAGATLNWLIVRQDVDYINQIPYRVAPYAVRTAPVALGRTSVTLGSEIFNPNDGTTFARGRTILVAADQNMAPTPLPSGPRAALAERLVNQG